MRIERVKNFTGASKWQKRARRSDHRDSTTAPARRQPGWAHGTFLTHEKPLDKLYCVSYSVCHILYGERYIQRRDSREPEAGTAPRVPDRRRPGAASDRAIRLHPPQGAGRRRAGDRRRNALSPTAAARNTGPFGEPMAGRGKAQQAFLPPVTGWRTDSGAVARRVAKHQHIAQQNSARGIDLQEEKRHEHIIQPKSQRTRRPIFAGSTLLGAETARRPDCRTGRRPAVANRGEGSRSRPSARPGRGVGDFKGLRDADGCGQPTGTETLPHWACPVSHL